VIRTITLDIAGAPESYPVIVGTKLLGRLSALLPLNGYSRVFVVTDEVVGPLYFDKLARGLTIPVHRIVFPPGEEQKNLENASKIWSAMHRAGCDRKTLVVALGGGVIGDLAGFAAATYMRGVGYIQVPTTLLSQVDSGLGGKTHIDFDGVKNLVGVFDQPAAVVIDTDTLKTLPERDIVANFAEIIKHGLIQDIEYLEFVTSKRPREFSVAELTDIIAGSVQIKADVVMSDPNESGRRSLLNFGHTVGHAVEVLSLETAVPLRHGEAVSIGMVVEATLSEMHGLLTRAEAGRVRQVLKAAGLPVAVPLFDMERMFEKMASDKKNAYGVLRFSLLKGLGDVAWYQEATRGEVAAAIEAHQEQAR